LSTLTTGLKGEKMEIAEIISKKEKLAQKKIRLEKQGKLIASKERKIQLKQLIELGELVKKSGLEQLEAETLLGALLEIKALSSDGKATQKWAEMGKAHLQDDHLNVFKPLIIQFAKDPSSESKRMLRAKKFRWNAFRQEWYGYGKTEDLSQFLKKQNEDAKIIQPKD